MISKGARLSLTVGSALAALWVGAGLSADARPAASPGAALAAIPEARSTLLDPSLAPARAERLEGAGRTYRSGGAPFRLDLDRRPVRFAVTGTLVLPGASVDLTLPTGREGHVLRHQAGTATEAPGGWRWVAPDEPGVYAARVESPEGTAVRFNLIVAHPAAHVTDGELHGYRIGAYAKTPLRGLDAYRPPRAFAEVRSEESDILVSPHFTLGQFLCKQPGEPRFLALSIPLVEKLEALLAELNRAGYATPSLHVMSGFRTPAYNRAIGNTTTSSRHLWGDAADVFVDVDEDGQMDDLNRDGRSDYLDARVVSAIADRVERTPGASVRPGGLSVYRRNAAHGPFVHIDARGYAARW